MEDHGNKGIVLMETRVHLYIHVYHVSEVSLCKLCLKFLVLFYSVSYDKNVEYFFNCMQNVGC